MDAPADLWITSRPHATGGTVAACTGSRSLPGLRRLWRDDRRRPTRHRPGQRDRHRAARRRVARVLDTAGRHPVPSAPCSATRPRSASPARSDRALAGGAPRTARRARRSADSGDAARRCPSRAGAASCATRPPPIALDRHADRRASAPSARPPAEALRRRRRAAPVLVTGARPARRADRAPRWPPPASGTSTRRHAAGSGPADVAVGGLRRPTPTGHAAPPPPTRSAAPRPTRDTGRCAHGAATFVVQVGQRRAGGAGRLRVMPGVAPPTC